MNDDYDPVVSVALPFSLAKKMTKPWYLVSQVQAKIVRQAMQIAIDIPTCDVCGKPAGEDPHFGHEEGCLRIGCSCDMTFHAECCLECKESGDE